MKPENWNELSKEEKFETARNLLRSVRGQYIVSQALYKGIEVMKKEPLRKRKVSNIEDMEMLSELFPICFITKRSD